MNAAATTQRRQHGWLRRPALGCETAGDDGDDDDDSSSNVSLRKREKPFQTEARNSKSSCSKKRSLPKDGTDSSPLISTPSQQQHKKRQHDSSTSTNERPLSTKKQFDLKPAAYIPSTCWTAQENFRLLTCLRFWTGKTLDWQKLVQESLPRRTAQEAQAHWTACADAFKKELICCYSLPTTAKVQLLPRQFLKRKSDEIAARDSALSSTSLSWSPPRSPNYGLNEYQVGHVVRLDPNINRQDLLRVMNQVSRNGKEERKLDTIPAAFKAFKGADSAMDYNDCSHRQAEDTKSTQQQQQQQQRQVMIHHHSSNTPRKAYPSPRQAVFPNPSSPFLSPRPRLLSPSSGATSASARRLSLEIDDDSAFSSSRHNRFNGDDAPLPSATTRQEMSAPSKSQPQQQQQFNGSASAYTINQDVRAGSRSAQRVEACGLPIPVAPSHERQRSTDRPRSMNLMKRIHKISPSPGQQKPTTRYVQRSLQNRNQIEKSTRTDLAQMPHPRMLESKNRHDGPRTLERKHGHSDSDYDNSKMVVGIATDSLVLCSATKPQHRPTAQQKQRKLKDAANNSLLVNVGSIQRKASAEEILPDEESGKRAVLVKKRQLDQFLEVVKRRQPLEPPAPSMEILIPQPLARDDMIRDHDPLPRYNVMHPVETHPLPEQPLPQENKQDSGPGTAMTSDADPAMAPQSYAYSVAQASLDVMKQQKKAQRRRQAFEPLDSPSLSHQDSCMVGNEDIPQMQRNTSPQHCPNDESSRPHPGQKVLETWLQKEVNNELSAERPRGPDPPSEQELKQVEVAVYPVAEERKPRKGTVARPPDPPAKEEDDAWVSDFHVNPTCSPRTPLAAVDPPPTLEIKRPNDSDEESDDDKQDCIHKPTGMQQQDSKNTSSVAKNRLRKSVSSSANDGRKDHPGSMAKGGKEDCTLARPNTQKRSNSKSSTPTPAKKQQRAKSASLVASKTLE